METITITTYQIDELNDEAKQKAINDFLSDGVHYDFFQWEYEQLAYELSDAKNVLIGAGDFPVYLQDLVKEGSLYKMKIEELDTYRGICKVNFCLEYSKEEAKLIDSEDYDESRRGEAMYEAREQQVRKDLQDFCLSWMRKAEEWITSEEYVIEHMKANEHKFLENGELFSY